MNHVSGNPIIENCVSGNCVSENRFSGNCISGNRVNGNCVIGPSLVRTMLCLTALLKAVSVCVVGRFINCH